MFADTVRIVNRDNMSHLTSLLELRKLQLKNVSQLSSMHMFHTRHRIQMDQTPCDVLHCMQVSLEVATLQQISWLPTLESLELRGCRNLSDNSIVPLYSRLTSEPAYPSLPPGCKIPIRERLPPCK